MLQCLFLIFYQNLFPCICCGVVSSFSLYILLCLFLTLLVSVSSLILFLVGFPVFISYGVFFYYFHLLCLSCFSFPCLPSTANLPIPVKKMT